MNAPLPSALFAGTVVTGPRFREAGDITLDQLHHDGRVDDVWLGLHPREFAMLWHLAERPGKPIAETQLAADLWQTRFGCETGSIAAHIERLRARLKAVGLAQLIASDGAGHYFLAVPPASGLLPVPAARGH